MLTREQVRMSLQFLFQQGFIWFLKERMREYAKLKDVSKISMKNASDFSSSVVRTGGNDKRVLVEMLNFHPTLNYRVSLIWLLLAAKYGGEGVALTEIGRGSAALAIAKAFGISGSAQVFQWFNPVGVVRALLGTIGYALTVKKNPNQLVYYEYDGQIVGDLIYDEYLRLTGKPTASAMDTFYFVFAYRALYRYLRYKKIILANNITDIVLTHNVYAKHGLIIKAAAACSEKIKFWVTAYQKPIAVSCNDATSGSIPKAQYYKREFGALIRSLRSDAEIEAEYEAAIARRMGGEDENQWDVQYAYKGNEIVNVDQFKNAYGLTDKAIFIMAHVFVDAVRYPERQIFKDNYTWLCETMLLLAERSKDEKIFIKPHPSEGDQRYQGCEGTVPELVEKMNREYGAKFICLTKKMHNRVVMDLAKVIVTSHGTIGIEAPCFGVPVIAASSCQYEEAGAIIQPKDRDGYERLLGDIDHLPVLTDEQVFNAKLAFLWFNKYAFVDSEILPDLRPLDSEDVKDDLVKINAAFSGVGRLDDLELYRVFSEMLDHDRHDFIHVH